MNLVWRGRCRAAHQPYGLLWELVDGGLRFNRYDGVDAWLSPVYAHIHRTGKRRYEVCAFPYTLTKGRPPTLKTFRSLTQAKAWAQATVLLSSD